MPGDFYKREGFDEALRTAAQIGGPSDTQPPNARAPFPMVALPRVLGAFVRDATTAMGVAPECVATPAMAVCATAIGNTCRIKLNTTWSEPSVIWAVTLMESGSLKTPAYNAAMEPLMAAQRLCEESFRHEQTNHKQATLQHEAALETWRAKVAAEPNLQPPPEPQEPNAIDHYTSDSTVEALAILFSNNTRGLAITRDELSGFFGSFGAYKGGRGSDESAYLEFYNAGSVKLNRASGKRIYVHNAALSIFGTCQPAVFGNAVGAAGSKSNQVDNGLAARFLIASPEGKAKSWRDPKPYNARPYHAMVNELLSIPLPLDADGRVIPASIMLQPEATARFKEFVNEHGKQTAGIANAALRYHYAKLEAVAARLALIFYLCDSATEDLDGSPEVQERHILGGIALARWYGREACRVYDNYESQAQREQHELLEKIRALGGVITASQMHDLRHKWRSVEAAEMDLQALARSGHGEFVIEPSGPRGGRPSVRFRLFDEGAPRTTPEIPENSQLSGPGCG